MDDNTNPQTEFQDALVAEMTEPSVPDNPTPSPAPTADSGEGTDTADAPAQVSSGVDEPAKAGADKVETPEEAANKEAETAAEDATEDEPKFATKQDVIDAMREYNSETTARVEQLDTIKKEIIETAYPQGIDQNIYDTDGNVIKTAQDIVDRGLINERTQEAFTYEEAASFMLQASQKVAENVKELQDWAGDVAEKNISLIDSNQRVMSQWGDVLGAMPNLAKQLADKYVSTQLEFDKSNSYITRMGMAPEDFYTIALGPYKQYGEALAAKEQQNATNQVADATNEQNERMGLPPQRGQAVVSSNTGDPMLDALIDEMNKG